MAQYKNNQNYNNKGKGATPSGNRQIKEKNRSQFFRVWGPMHLVFSPDQLKPGSKEIKKFDAAWTGYQQNIRMAKAEQQEADSSTTGKDGKKKHFSLGKKAHKQVGKNGRQAQGKDYTKARDPNQYRKESDYIKSHSSGLDRAKDYNKTLSLWNYSHAKVNDKQGSKSSNKAYRRFAHDYMYNKARGLASIKNPGERKAAGADYDANFTRGYMTGSYDSMQYQSKQNMKNHKLVNFQGGNKPNKRSMNDPINKHLSNAISSYETAENGRKWTKLMAKKGNPKAQSKVRQARMNNMSPYGGRALANKLNKPLNKSIAMDKSLRVNRRPLGRFILAIKEQMAQSNEDIVNSPTLNALTPKTWAKAGKHFSEHRKVKRMRKTLRKRVDPNHKTTVQNILGTGKNLGEHTKNSFTNGGRYAKNILKGTFSSGKKAFQGVAQTLGDKGLDNSQKGPGHDDGPEL